MKVEKEETFVSKIQLYFKIMELFLAIICVGLSNFAPAKTIPHHNLISITFGGYVMVLSGLFLSHIYNKRMFVIIDRMYSVMGAILFLAAGWVALDIYDNEYNPRRPPTPPPEPIFYWVERLPSTTTEIPYHDKRWTINVGLSMGSLAIINSCLFIIDLVLSFLDRKEAETDSVMQEGTIEFVHTDQSNEEA